MLAACSRRMVWRFGCLGHVRMDYSTQLLHVPMCLCFREYVDGCSAAVCGGVRVRRKRQRKKDCCSALVLRWTVVPFCIPLVDLRVGVA
ncbi:trans-sialidase, putative [Trypanosoma cruzi]|nr:trans-sialidase, putative [Trypanosoma cruzi]